MHTHVYTHIYTYTYILEGIPHSITVVIFSKSYNMREKKIFPLGGICFKKSAIESWSHREWHIHSKRHER